jgi:hypothetical protein
MGKGKFRNTKVNIHIYSNWGFYHQILVYVRFCFVLFCFTMLVRVKILKHVSKSGLFFLTGQIVKNYCC